MKDFKYKWFYKLGYYQPSRPRFLYNFFDWVRYEFLYDPNDDRHYY